MAKRVIITGGIGTGKSVVSTMLKVMRYPVYDCDSMALKLMNEDTALVEQITRLLGVQAYDRQRRYDRIWVASKVFEQPVLLDRLNALVHPAVARDIDRWQQSASADIVFVETALMRQSGLHEHADAIWRVTAPDTLRVLRVQRRSGLTAEQVGKRIEAQRLKEIPCQGEVVLNNDGVTPLMPQLIDALAKLNQNNI